MNVPFVDLAAQYANIKTEIAAAIDAVLDDRTFILGPHVMEFEAHFATFCKAGHCVGVGNGTDALAIALTSLGVGPGHEVLVPANSFVATSEAVTMCGAQVVFVDVDPLGYHLDLEQARAKVTPRTKAVVPVHLYGQPADMIGIRTLANEFNLKVVQDCAQAHGATFDGRPLATFGDACCYSFFPGKNLGAYGDAGAIVTDNANLALRCRMHANHGRIGKYDHEFEGVNSRMDGLQGAILDVKLGHLDAWTEARRAAAARYDDMLKGLPGLTLPKARPGRRHVYHLYVVRHPRRDALQAHLKKCGVVTGVHYPIALPNLTAYKHLGHTNADFPIASRLAGEILSLPLYPELTLKQIEYVTTQMNKFCRQEPT